MFTVAQFIGVLLIVLGTGSFLLNIFMMYVFISKRLISEKHENYAIYRLILNFLVCDTIEVTPTIYIALCAVLEKDLLQNEAALVPGTINLWMWYQTLLMLITMAVNRYVGICHFNRYASIFNARTATIIIVATWIISAFVTVLSQFIVSCCAMIPYYPIFTFTFVNPLQLENITYKYNPSSQACCLILLFCYGRILWKVHRSSRVALSTMDRSVQRHRTRQNTRFAIQFVLISLFFVLMYSFYTLFPKILPVDVVLPYSAIAFCMVAHCTLNSVMYLMFNPEVKRLALQTLCGKASVGRFNFETRTVNRSHVTTMQMRRVEAWETTAH